MHITMINLTEPELSETPVRRGVMSDEEFVTSDYVIGYIILFISLVGVATNFICIRTFIVMGLEDGVTVSLFGLAISDLGFTFCGTVLGSSNVIAAIELRHGIVGLPISPKFVFGMFAANVGFMFYQITCMTTTFIAVARCMCVSMPFTFKDFFTKWRSTFALVSFSTMAAVSYAPVLSQMGVQMKFDPIVNTTRIVLWMSEKRSDWKDAVTFVHFVLFVMASSLVVGVCILVMAKHLRQSLQFRHSMTSSMSAESTAGPPTKDGTGYKLSGKELQVVRQVIVICLLYTLSMIPNIFLALYRLVEEDFDVGKRLHNLYFTISAACIALQLVNSASTFPVYYFYNSKFRSLCFYTTFSKSTK